MSLEKFKVASLKDKLKAKEIDAVIEKVEKVTKVEQTLKAKKGK